MSLEPVDSSEGLFSSTKAATQGMPVTTALMVETESSKVTSIEEDTSEKRSELISSDDERQSHEPMEENTETLWESTREKRSLIVELDERDSGGRPGVREPTVSSHSRGFEEGEAEDGSGWAVRSLQDRHSMEARGSTCKEGGLEIEDLEEQTTSVDSSQSDRPKKYAFEQLSDVPAVRDPSEIEAAEIALEKIKGKPAHELSAEERVWKLAAEGGSTLASERVELDHESKERVKETLRKHKLTDKTTLAF